MRETRNLYVSEEMIIIRCQRIDIVETMNNKTTEITALWQKSLYNNKNYDQHVHTRF